MSNWRRSQKLPNSGSLLSLVILVNSSANVIELTRDFSSHYSDCLLIYMLFLALNYLCNTMLFDLVNQIFVIKCKTAWRGCQIEIRSENRKVATQSLDSCFHRNDKK